jgi:putative hydrolase of the HAD superfamily
MTKAIIFDWGNTLMREVPIHRRPSVHSPRVELVPGVAEALEALHQRYVCCVASNARGPEATTLGLVLEQTGLDRYFQRLFTAQSIGTEKPSTSFFLSILDELKTEPQDCIMVGDDYANDITGAKAVGMRTVWFTGATAREVTNADVIISSMDELVPAVTKIDSRG